MAEIRDRAKEILKVVPEPPRQINSDGPTAALFTRLTGTSHATMWQNWLSGGIMTACNGFVGWYGVQLGSTKYLGRFDLDTYLPSIGKGYAWVKSTKDARPKYGDICRHTAFHVGVSLDFDEDDKWGHVDAGQGGPSRNKAKQLIGGHDVLKRTYGTTPYDYKKLQGWIDIELYFGAGAQTDPVPGWLLGWWKVVWRGQAYYYYFFGNRQVKWTQTEPAGVLQPLLGANDTGSFAVDDNGVIIRWAATGSVEKFSSGLGDDAGPMQGKWNDSEALTATKM